MERTKKAWKVVSDPYAPESNWVPACAETEMTSLVPEALAPKSAPRTLLEVVLISAVVAGLGGAFGGECVHVLYYAQHLFGQIVYGDVNFEVWGSFYSWFNQPNALLVYIPFFFSFSMGFLTKAYDQIRSIAGVDRTILGKPAAILNFIILAIYLTVVGFNSVTGSFDPLSYVTVLGATGVIGAALAFFFGKSIACNLACVTRPERVFNAMLWGLAPAVLFCKGLPFLDSFGSALFLCLSIPFIGGLMAASTTGASAPRSAALLAHSIASPMLFCALLHLPMAVWFALNWTVDASYGMLAGFSRDVFYFLALPATALLLPIAGGLIGSRFVHKQEEETLAFAPTTAKEICPLPVAHPIEQP